MTWLLIGLNVWATRHLSLMHRRRYVTARNVP